jgi:shikimate dehydrogenase
LSQASVVRRAGLIGFPVAHSISPQFQQAAFDALSISVRYERWETAPGDLPRRIAGLRDDAIVGANVTVPHKQAVVSLADELAAEARIVGAANTLVKRDGRLIAYNTDVGGFRRAIENEFGHIPRNTRAAVIGAGGAARAVIAALNLDGIAWATVLNRSVARAERLVSEMEGAMEIRLKAAALDEAAATYLEGCDLIVNCTSVGLAGTTSEGESPLQAYDLPLGAAVVDVIANPLITPLLRQAAAGGRPVLGGLPMLVHQGALAFELWTGRPAPIDIMMRAARVAMGLSEATVVPPERTR